MPPSRVSICRKDYGTKLKVKRGEGVSYDESKIVQAAIGGIATDRSWTLSSRRASRWTVKQTRPARIPMTDICVRELKKASKETGIPVCRLLLACIALTCDGEEE